MIFKRFQNLYRHFYKNYPYNNRGRGFLLLDYLLLRVLPIHSFPGISIVPLVKKAYNLNPDEEFRTRYYVSRIGFEEQWNLRPRLSKEDVESFYAEHDKDIWRQAHFSKYDYSYKKKILRIYHIIKSELAKNEPILDYGCGAGVLVHYLIQKGYTTIDAADIRSESLNFLTKTMGASVRKIITLNKSPQPLEKGAYSLITVLDCLEHVYNPIEAIGNILRALQVGGILIISFPKEGDFSSTHLEKAQNERSKVFDLISQKCTVIVPEFIYSKK